MYNLLENPRCSNFISNLLNTARQLTGNKPLSYSAKELIGIIASEPNDGYRFRPNYSGGSGGGEAGYGTGAASATIGGLSYKYLQDYCGGKPYNGGGAELGTVP